MILLAGQAITMLFPKLKKIWNENWNALFPGCMQAYFRTVLDSLGLSVDSLSGCLAKVVHIPAELHSFGLCL